MSKDLKNKTCCFTGHRKIKKENQKLIEKLLEIEITRLIQKGVCYFGSGGALGFDTISALAVLKMKSKYPHIRLIMVLSCPEQDKFWTIKDKIIYKNILNKADKVTYTSDRYTTDCMFIRNRWLVDNSSFCITYFRRKRSGTAYTVNYAKNKNVKVINIFEIMIKNVQ